MQSLSFYDTETLGLIQKLNGIAPLSAVLQDCIIGMLREDKPGKRELLLRLGQVNRRVVFWALFYCGFITVGTVYNGVANCRNDADQFEWYQQKRLSEIRKPFFVVERIPVIFCRM